jgi:hypothetical protein
MVLQPPQHYVGKATRSTRLLGSARRPGIGHRVRLRLPSELRSFMGTREWRGSPWHIRENTEGGYVSCVDCRSQANVRLRTYSSVWDAWSPATGGPALRLGQHPLERGPCRDLTSRGESQFIQDMGHVGLCRPFGDHQARGDSCTVLHRSLFVVRGALIPTLNGSYSGSAAGRYHRRALIAGSCAGHLTRSLSSPSHHLRRTPARS